MTTPSKAHSIWTTTVLVVLNLVLSWMRAVSLTDSSTSSSSRMLYFAYGSMCNPVSLNRRGLFPTASTPALLKGYRLTWQLGETDEGVVVPHALCCCLALHPFTLPTPAASPTGGMANIVPDTSSSCHGVVHTVTEAEFAILKEIESSYETLEASVIPYAPAASAGISDPHQHHASTAAGSSAATMTATAFIVHQSALTAMAQEHPEWANSLPSDRYIRIITAGLRHFGADAAWVDWIAAQPCKHGRQLHEYLKAAPAPAQDNQHGLPSFTLQELSAHASKLRGDHKVVFAIGPKVIEVDFSSKPTAALVTILENHFLGRQTAFHTCMMLHEPNLPPISCPADLQPEHIEWAEDIALDWVGQHGFPAQQVGWLVEGEQDNTGSTGGGGSAGGAGTIAAAAAVADTAAVVNDAAETLHEEDEATAAPETGLFTR